MGDGSGSVVTPAARVPIAPALSWRGVVLGSTILCTDHLTMGPLSTGARSRQLPVASRGERAILTG